LLYGTAVVLAGGVGYWWWRRRKQRKLGRAVQAIAAL
jgi:hypothetical protein